MTVLSLLRSFQPARNGWASVNPLKNNSGLQNKGAAVLTSQRLISTGKTIFGGHGPRTMVILPSKFQWQKYKDLLHFYTLLGAIPMLALVFYVDVFIGPATLTEIPCGHEPKNWEYYKHPIQRWIARYIIPTPQQIYERNLHYIKEMDEERRLRRLTTKIENLMKERGDYPNYYVSKVNMGKYIRGRIATDERIEDLRGNN